MNKSLQHSPRRARFSLRQLLVLTAFAALGSGYAIAYQRYKSLSLRHSALQSLSTQLRVVDPSQLCFVPLPAVASKFQSWHVHVPTGGEFELRLGFGDLHQNGFPEQFESVRIPSGTHRITLEKHDSVESGFQYLVYLDGEVAIERTMGSEWLPTGWSSASGVSWPFQELSDFSEAPLPQPIQLAAQLYQPRRDFGNNNYVNLQSDSDITQKGYRLWLDRSEASYPISSPFTMLPKSRTTRFASNARGLGLRDGLRFLQQNKVFSIIRPSLGSLESIIQLDMEVTYTDGKVFSTKNAIQSYWTATGYETKAPWRFEMNPTTLTGTALVKMNVNPEQVPAPVLELSWDANRLDDVALRLVDTPENVAVTHWTIKISKGQEHLWRHVEVGNGASYSASDLAQDVSSNLIDVELPNEFNEDLAPMVQSRKSVVLDTSNAEMQDLELRWKTDQTLPLQVVERNNNIYSGMNLYDGLPVQFGLRIPSAFQPKVTAEILEKDPNAPDQTYPGGAVLEQLQIDLEAKRGEWINFTVQPRE